MVTWSLIFFLLEWKNVHLYYLICHWLWMHTYEFPYHTVHGMFKADDITLLILWYWTHDDSILQICMRYIWYSDFAWSLLYMQIKQLKMRWFLLHQAFYIDPGPHALSLSVFIGLTFRRNNAHIILLSFLWAMHSTL